MSTPTEIELTEQADVAFAGGKLESALRGYAALLDGRPDDLYVWYRTATTLARLGDKQTAQRSLEGLCTALAESGQLLLALAAAKELEALAPEVAAGRLDAVAKLYGAGSKRVDQQRRPAPPPVPSRPPGAQMASADAADGRVLRVMAADACDRALETSSGARRGQAALPFHPLLSDLSSEDLVKVVPLMKLRVLPAKAPAIEQGDEGTSMFIVVRGVAEVRRDEQHLAYLRSGAFFGEMALLTRSPRTASVVGYTPLTLFELDRVALEELAARNAAVAEVLAGYTRQRLLRNVMATSPLFQPLTAERRAELIDLFVSQVFEDGAPVVQEGKPSEGLYVVLSGAVQVSTKENGDPLTLAQLGPGQVFGEISLLQKRSATATVTASGKAVVLLLPRPAFNEHVGQFPEVLAHVYQLANERVEAHERLKSAPLLPIDDDVLV